MKMNNDKSRLAQMFQEWRIKKQLTMKDIADKLHISACDVSDFINDHKPKEYSIEHEQKQDMITMFFMCELMKEKREKEHTPNFDITNGIFIDTAEDIETMHGYLNKDDD